MDKQTMNTELKAHAEYLRQVRLPLVEREAIERVLVCAASLERLANEIMKEEVEQAQE